jgi:transposase-like protein
VDKQGKTVESYLSRTRDITAAKAFFRRALRPSRRPTSNYPGRVRAHACRLASDGHEQRFNYRWEGAVHIRTCPYLNNVVEQDHRRIKARVAPMLGFKRFFNARRVVAGVELVQKIIKAQFDVPESFGNDPFAVWSNVLAA